MNELKFNSQTCTTIEQSKKLLELGLKPETADMIHNYDNRSNFYSEWEWRILPYKWHAESLVDDEHIPAWSLHRLIELWFSCNKQDDCYMVSQEDAFDNIITDIGWYIKYNIFNKEYLKL